ncbi:uncharacterized protein LOC114365371 [Ostrinia furnacalis]|uniref:uncharacterized protein LOC114365371 n=1 Tax=Ostrinia furnacalis TaxID=93504 RepID=UPI00103D89ED|nr:uncharacterized protein LOC114365371 [Ostrinia furnacalis]
MSDSEFEVFEPVQKAKPKRKLTSRDTVRSDSEFEASEPVQRAKPKRKPTSRDRSHSSKKPKSNPKESFDVLGVLSDEEEAIEKATRASNEPRRLDSSFSSKTAHGSLVWRAPLAGRYYVETRVYSADDARKAPPDQRYTKALVTLKAQLDSEQAEWDYLQRFLKKAKTLFSDTKPVFYDNKINKVGLK